MKESFFRRLWPELPIWRGLDFGVLLVMIYAVTIEVVVQQFAIKAPKWIGDFNVVNAILLGVLLAFRNKEAYERWWEGRKLWGQLINESRNFALKLDAYLAPGGAERQTAARLVDAFAYALKLHLRDRPRTHEPARLAGELMKALQTWKLSDVERLMLDPHVRGLMDVCGACERIQSSPVPQSYRSLLRHGTIIYLASAPWFLAGEFGFWGVAIVGLIAYFLLGTELTAESIENPFGTGGDDLLLSNYCETIRQSLTDILQAKLP